MLEHKGQVRAKYLFGLLIRHGLQPSGESIYLRELIREYLFDLSFQKKILSNQRKGRRNHKKNNATTSKNC